MFTKTIEVGENRIIEFNIPDEWAEFNISFTKENAEDDIAITGIEIHSAGETGIHEVQGEATSTAGIYNLSGVRTHGMTRGINIIKGNDGKTRKVLGR